MMLPCDEGEVELWGMCYSIENTTVLSNLDNVSGEIPEKLCALINLEVLNLIVMFGSTNSLTGEIPDCICNNHGINKNFKNLYFITFLKDQLILITC